MLRYLNVCFPFDGTVLGGLGGVVLLEEVHYWATLRFDSMCVGGLLVFVCVFFVVVVSFGLLCFFSV